jgi:hypothetical protein
MGTVMSKKNVRAEFRHACYERDDHCCAMCGWKPSKEAWASYYEHPQQIPSAAPLDAHHVTDRTLMPWGGYVKENGISLCSQCHGFAEQYHITGKAHPDIPRLICTIGSSRIILWLCFAVSNSKTESAMKT